MDFVLDRMLPGSMSISIIEYLDKSHPGKREEKSQTKAIIDKESAVSYISQNPI